MLRPRILSTYNYKRQDTDKKGKEEELDERESIISQIKIAQPDFAELKIINNKTGNNEIEQRKQFEMGVSVSEEVRHNITIKLPVVEKLSSHGKPGSDNAFQVFHQNMFVLQPSITCRSEKVVQTRKQRSINVVRLMPHTSAKVYRLVPKSSKSVAQCVTSSSTKTGQLIDSSSLRAEKFLQNPSVRTGKLPSSHASGRVVKLVSNSSTRVAKFVPNSSKRVAHLVSNSSMRVTHFIPKSPKKMPALVPASSPRLSQSSTNVPPTLTKSRPNSPAGVAALILNPSTSVMELVSNSPAQLPLVRSGSPKIDQTAPRSPKKVPPLIKFSPTKATGFAADSPALSVPRPRGKPSVKSVQLLRRADNDFSAVTVSPIPGRDATGVQSQTISMLEKIQHLKDVTRVQPVIGIPRQHCTSENNTLESNSPKLGIVQPHVIEPKFEDNVSKESSTKLENMDNVDGKEEITEIHEASLTEETIEEDKAVVKTEKSSDLNDSGNDVFNNAKRISSTTRNTDTKEPQADVELVDVKGTTNKSNFSRKQSKTTVSSRKKMEEKVSGNKATTRITTRIRKSTILMTRRRNTRSAARPNQTKPKISAVPKIQGHSTKMLASFNPPVKNRWRAQCIICKDRFTDKYEFHRHVTLSHPGIRIVFCELCNASFRSDIELKQHRYSYHKITVTKDAENNLIKLEAPIKPIVNLENEPKRPKPKMKSLDDRKLENRKKMANHKRANFEPIAARSNDPFRSRSMKKNLTGSSTKTGKSKENSKPDSATIGPQKRKSQKKSEKSKYSYVDIDIIDHKAITMNETFINAERRKLIIPIVRLDGLVVEKYLLESVKKPETNFVSASINEHANLLDTKKKPKILSKQKKRSVGSRPNRVSKKSGNRATRIISKKRRRTLLSNKTLKDEKNVTIRHDPKVVQLNLSTAKTPTAPRRSSRGRIEKKSFDRDSEDISNNAFAKIKPLDGEIESPKNEEFSNLKKPSSDDSRSSQDFTLIDIDDEPEVAEIVDEQRVIKKLVARSSVASCSSTFDHNHHQDQSNFGLLSADSVDREPPYSPKRKSSICLSKKGSELKPTPKNDEVSSLLSKSSGSTSHSEKSMRKSEKLNQSRPSRAQNSQSIGNNEKLITDKRTTRIPRFSCLNLYDIDSSNDSDRSENRDGEFDESPNKHDKRAVVNKNIRDKNSIVRKGKKGDAKAQEKVDDKNELSEEKVDGEDNQEKKQNSSDGKNLDEKSTGAGNQNNGSVNEDEKYSKAKSNVTEKLRKKQSDDEDEDPKRRINDDAKKLKEKVEDEDDEQEEKAEDEEKQLEHKNQAEKGNLGEKSKHEELTNQNDPNNKIQFEHSYNVDDEKCLNNKKNPRLENEEKIEKSLQTKTSSDLSETPVRKTYSSSKKLLEGSKQPKQSGDKIEKLQDLCSVCKKLCALMKKVSGLVGDRNTTEIPIKCPLCQRYFISMFHLELHVATNHMQCLKEIPCKTVESPIVKKASTVTQLDCESRIDPATECLRCEMKFSTEKDLNDHLIAKHEIRYPKDKSSNVYPEYIRDLRTSLLETNGQKNVVTSSKSSEGSGPNLTSQTDENKTTTATLDCSLCDEKFVESTKYVRHVREIHNTSKISSPADRQRSSCKSLSNEDKLSSLFKEPAPNVSEGSSTFNVEELEEAMKTEKIDLAKSDRDYVLKQLLSDNSSSDDEDEEKNSQSSSFKKPTKETIVQKSMDKINADCSSSFHTCEICQKTFKREQDLLLHQVSHIDNKISKDSENGKLGTKTECDDRSEVFVLSESEDESNFDESENAEYDEFSLTKQRVFVYNEKERDNVAVVFGTNGASEKVVVGSKRRATLASYETSEVSKIEEKAIPLKKHKISNSNKPQDKNVCPTGKEPRDARKHAMKQLIETEVGLTDEIDKSLPIACGKCNRHFATRSLLNEHLFFLHDDSLKDTVLTDVLKPIGGLRGFDENDSSQRWSCETCVQNFKLFQGYSRHRYFVHGDDSMVHVCDNCSKVMTNVTMVNVHICTDVASYNCRTCNETFQTGMSLRLHNTEKHMETNGPHKCNDCKKNFLTSGMLERHKNSKHRFVRPYRARKISPVRMGEPDTTNSEDIEKSVDSDKCCEEEIDKTSRKRNSTREEDSIITCDPLTVRRGTWRACRDKKKVEEESPVSQTSPTLLEGKKKRGRPRKNTLLDEESSSKRSQEEGDEEDNFEERPIVYRDSLLYIDETEIHQCSLCQLYCLSKSTLRNHMAKIHSTTDEICQLCQKMYPTGKLIRHMIESHITSDDGEVLGPETSWRIGTNSNEIDAEILIKMLGIDRLVSLCEYRRFSEKNRLTSYPCVPCKKYFASHELYKYHFLLHHDPFCALCNIEFKTGHDAARHKSEIHGSVGRYIWFADRTVMALTSTKNFTDATESIFMERITREENAGNDEAEENDEDEEQMQHSLGTQVLLSNNLKQNIETSYEEPRHKDDINAMEKKIVATNQEIIPRDGKSGPDINVAEAIVDADKIAKKSIDPNISTNRTSNTSINHVPTISSEEETFIDNVSSASDDFIQPDDVNLIIIVTDDDLEKFNITTRYPNIWGLAAKISSTYEEVTPNQVKEMLECHFEREEDFDT